MPVQSCLLGELAGGDHRRRLQADRWGSGCGGWIVQGQGEPADRSCLLGVCSHVGVPESGGASGHGQAGADGEAGDCDGE
jgi:hypothetical protein